MSLLTLSLLVLCSLNQAASEVYYITANSAAPCTVQPCLTLSQFAANSSHSLHSNTTLVFLPGTHHLSNVNLTLSNVDNFVMKSENSTAQIKCISNSTMHFYQSQSIHIANLEFIGCGGNQVRYVEEFVVEDTKFKGQENSRTALELIKTSAQIINSTFLSNRIGSYRKCIFPRYGCVFNGFIGGAIIATNSTVEINQSRFEDNGADLGGAIFAEQDSIINMSGNVFVSNNARIGGVLGSFSSTITIEASEVHDNSAKDYGVGVLYSISSTITIEASEFQDNRARWVGGVLYSRSSTITIEASEFQDNSATACGGGVLYSEGSTYITIEASEFHNNSAWYGGVLYSISSTITIEASEFHNNSANYRDGGVLYSSSSTITIEASKFHKISASYGGVLYYSSGSAITIEASKFHDNSARGGGVLDSSSSTITIEASEFHDNSAS